YEANITRVITYMKSRDASQRVYPNIGVNEPHHAMSHHGNNPEKLAGLVKLNTYHVSLFSKFVERLQSTPDGDGSLLDHSLILYGSGMSESDTHLRLKVRSLLKQRPDVNGREPDGMTALHWAVRNDDAETAQLLIRSGANVKAANRYGVTPISLAATNGNATLVEALLKAGADPNDAQPE